MAMTCNDFKKAIEAEFGACEYRATKGDQVITSDGWPTSKSHPANASDSKYVIPNIERKQECEPTKRPKHYKTR